MTIPIIPGPFSFLAEAGEAAGAYGKEKEERKRHAEQIAEHGSNFIMESILKGADPSILDHPDVQQMMKKAYGFVFPSSIGKALGAEARGKAHQIEEEEKAGVPTATAEAEAAVAKRTKAGATSELEAGVPDKEARAKAAVAQANQEGAKLNINIFKGADALLGSDPKFARLAYEAATGALDARFRYWEMQRANLTLERQKMVDRLSIAKDELKEVGARFDKAQQAWEKQQELFLLDKGDTPENRRAFAEANPPPDENEIAEKYIRSVHGYGREEFQRRMNEITEELTKPDTTGTTQAKPATKPTEGTQAPATKPPTGTAKVQKAIGRLSKADPEEAAEALADLVSTDDLIQEEADAIKFQLGETMPGSWYKKFSRAYAGASLRK